MSEMKIKSKEEALEYLADVKGEFHSMCGELGKNTEWSKMMLLKLDMVQRYIDPDCDLNAIQTKVNQAKSKRK